MVLYNNLKVCPGEFLAKYPLKKKAKIDPPDLRVFLQQKCMDFEKVFQSKMQTFYMRLVHWITYMNSDNLKDGDHMMRNTSFLITRANLIIRGIKLATEIKRTLKQYLMLYEVNRASMNKS